MNKIILFTFFVLPSLMFGQSANSLIKEIEKQHNEIQQDLRRKKVKIRDLSSKIAKLSTDYTKKVTELEGATKQIVDYKSDLNLKQNRIEELITAIAYLRAENKSFNDINKKLQSTNEEITKELSLVKDDYSKLKKTLEDTKRKEILTQAELKSLYEVLNRGTKNKDKGIGIFLGAGGLISEKIGGSVQLTSGLSPFPKPNFFVGLGLSYNYYNNGYKCENFQTFAYFLSGKWTINKFGFRFFRDPDRPDEAGNGSGIFATTDIGSAIIIPVDDCSPYNKGGLYYNLGLGYFVMRQSIGYTLSLNYIKQNLTKYNEKQPIDNFSLNLGVLIKL